MDVSRQGRVAQRSRTRRDLVAAARALMARGELPTVATTADHASISRATAYRYFPSNDTLVVEAGLLQAIETSLQEASPPEVDDVPRAVEDLVRRVNARVRENEAQMRLFLRLSLTPNANGEPSFVRPASRLPLLDTVIAPLRTRLSERSLLRLRNSLALLMGIDPVVTMRDLCHLDDDEIADTLAWAAHTLVAAALAEEAANH